MSVAEIAPEEHMFRPNLRLVEPESAPVTSADFLFEESLRPPDSRSDDFEIFDPTYTAEWLPPIAELRNDISYLVSGRERGIPRLGLVVEYVDWLRSRIEPDGYQGDKEYARRQAGPRLFLDALSLVSRDRMYQHDSAKVGRRSPETFDDLKTLLEVKRDMKLDISSYVRLHPNTPHDVLFNNIQTLMGAARRVAFKDEVGSALSLQNNRRMLLGLLAENKVVDALQYNRWPLAHHASAELDSAGVDAVVPVDIKPTSAVALQVKSSNAPGAMFDIVARGNRHLVVVPMNPGTNDPFNLSRSDSLALNHFIYRAPRIRLASAA